MLDLNVSLCLSVIATESDKELGQSSCDKKSVALNKSPLPERVCLVCGDKAYSCMPFVGGHGMCYLTYLIILIRKVDSVEITSLYHPLHRHHRDITTPNHVLSIFTPWYGICVTQEELAILSTVIEKHVNSSTKAMIAEHRELQEVKTVALQNCMALDLLLA